MNKTLNQKGFTLIEVLAVLAILGIILVIAMPNIFPSLERTKKQQNEARYKLIESNAEQYVTDHKNKIYNNLQNNSTDTCYLEIKQITYLNKEEMLDSDGNDLSNYYIIFTKPNSYEYSTDKQNIIPCMQ